METNLAGQPNLADYESACRNFAWAAARRELAAGAGDARNAAVLAVDRHVREGRGERCALVWVGGAGQSRRYSYADLRRETDRWANALASLGLRAGDLVCTSLPRVPELYLALLAAVKLGATVAPLFAGLDPEVLRTRLGELAPRALLTSAGRWRPAPGEIPGLELVLAVDAGALPQAVARSDPEFSAVPAAETDPLYIIYTSGTTGRPRAVLHAHGDAPQQYLTSRWTLDLKESDTYWCPADPASVTGFVYGLFGPWLAGATQVVYGGPFTPASWYEVLAGQGVTVWYTAPAPLRLLSRAGLPEPQPQRLRHILSMGEPLTPDLLRWGRETFGLDIRDNWCQAEAGSVLISNYPAVPVRPGSMGKPFPGVTAAVIDARGRQLGPHQTGSLAFLPDWPALRRAIVNDPGRRRDRLRHGWYVTGDTAYRDEDGYYYFAGRAADVIDSSGARVSPTLVEAALMDHPAVLEAGVIGQPDPVHGETVKAFLVLRDGYEPSERLRESIVAHLREHLNGQANPRELEFIPALPKTRSGKVMRRILKAWDQGLPSGDVSNLKG